MAKSIRTLVVSVAAALAIVVWQTGTLRAVAPTVMMFYGGQLKQPVYVTGTDTSAFGDLLRRTTMRVRDLGDRPFLSVALFWGPQSDPARNGVHTLTELTPQMAWQHGRFYPPAGDQQAILLVTTLEKREQAVGVPGDGSPFVLGGPVPAGIAPVLARLGLSSRPTR